ncbi:hypothetical protein Jiend_57010 [Micromonospora endophytica]|uniref:hypothetical protein n=1 Tax=Micromonospora endophytica TaxID=515350 RepID=UPI001BB39B33|nr:hypothetical protein [Micromonospora endophytica]BCJ62279.1 hypothetical protein Jiend_57010 [Micromonospora endophytica]
MAATTTTPRFSALRRKRPNAPGELSKKFWASAVMWLLVVVYGFPVLWFLLSSVKPAGELFSYPLTFFPEDVTFKGTPRRGRASTSGRTSSTP